MKKSFVYLIGFLCLSLTAKGQYIEDQNTTAQNAKFWISGVGSMRSSATYSAIGQGQILFYNDSLVIRKRRWVMGLTNAATAAPNSGADFVLWRYDDAGNYIGGTLTVARATGIVNIPTGLAVTYVNTNNTNGVLSIAGGATGVDSYRGAEIGLRAGGYSTTPGEMTFHTGVGGGGTVQSERMRINAAGNVGIGAAVYYGKLSVYDATNGNASITLQSASNSRFWINESNNILKIGANGGATPPALGVINITNSGFVGIGTGNPPSELSVKGTITAQRVKVTQSGWADYVFHKDYSLPSLQEVAAYIDAHQHLEGIPSAAEVAKDGIDVGEMNKKLLAKVEELTLYLIEQNKKITALEEWKLQQENGRQL